MRISNLKIYGLEESVISSRLPMMKCIDNKKSKITKYNEQIDTAIKLAKCDIGSGHDNFLNGIVVQFDLTCSNKMWVELQRYHFIDFVSSQSTIHRLSSMDLDTCYNEYVDLLSKVSNIEIITFDDLCNALHKRIEFFNENGCKVSDHGLEQIYFEEFTESEIQNIFNKKRANQELSQDEILKFQSAVLIFLSETYHQFGWVQQFHLGALRNNNARMHRILGPDTGWDSIGDFPQARKISQFLNALDSKDKLTKTILYNLNPADNEVIATMIGNYNDGSVKGKVQFGSGWWFLDQKDGMIKQMNALSNMGLISCFIGMLTDSRSFLSFPRHEYFRRILCNLLGTEIEKGELPNDMELVGKMVADISYNNANEYFNF